MQSLLAAGANKNAQSLLGCTSLSMAAEAGADSAVAALLAVEANPATKETLLDRSPLWLVRPRC